MIFGLSLILIASFFIAGGSFLVKSGINALNRNQNFGEMALSFICSKYILVGYILNLLGLAFWYGALFRMDFRTAFPIYIATLLVLSQCLGIFALGEKMTPWSASIFAVMMSSTIAFAYLSASKL